MVVNPKDAAKITPEEREVINWLEKEIDEKILEDTKNKITHHTYKASGPIGQRVLDEIQSMYSSHYEVRIDCNESTPYILLRPKKR